MDYYEYLFSPNWKRLSDEDKLKVFDGIIASYISPKAQLQWREVTTFEQCGMKCRTVAFLLNGEDFVFIPGQKEALLGWDFGSQGLHPADLLLESTQSEGDEREDASDKLQTVAQLDAYINSHTTPLRKSEISPMLVAKNATPVGTLYQGKYNVVSGEFIGNHDFLAAHLDAIKAALIPPLTLAEALNWSLPRSYLENNSFYLQQTAADEDYYLLYEHRQTTYWELLLTLNTRGFELLSEDSWEYAVGGGTRRLFRWGNQLRYQSQHPFYGLSDLITKPNMFGLVIGRGEARFELTDTHQVVKLDLASDPKRPFIKQVLPHASYYRAQHQIGATELLAPTHYSCRKAIVLTR